MADKQEILVFTQEFSTFSLEFLKNHPQTSLQELISEFTKQKENQNVVEKKLYDGTFKEAFRSEYQDPLGVIAYLHQKLCFYTEAWNPDEYYFPGVAGVQTSGSGKSRSFITLSQKGVYVVYCSFLSENSTGYPKRSAIANYLSTNQISAEESELRFISFICACLLAVGICVREGISPSHLINNHLPSDKNSDDKFWLWI
ncbi:9870_t:CDS:1 [Funneliformis geosporum]|uniref:3164_t:CDS:1 n=1 Tax=Funneliformis geosporum TaxID=1117311 RepID=A0A9W4T487_9GLOM|nr:3164_t:CDS:1 [Funneliformis geosporum]CAI2194914.1 9870_t:CDS:1 [Funneliformis geosporum]